MRPSPAADDIEQRLLSQTVLRDFVRPCYRDYCLSSVPSTIFTFFGIRNGRPTIPSSEIQTKAHTEKLVLFVLDGLGYYDAKVHLGDKGFLHAAASAQALIPITSVFPSTTAAALTTLSTGLTPQEHCLPEWFVYLKELDRVITTLPFSAVGESGRDRLRGKMDPRTLFSGAIINLALKKAGVDVVSFVKSSLARTVYSRLTHRGSEVVPFITSSDLMASLRSRIERARRRTFFYVYMEAVDTIGHAYAPGSEASSSEVSLASYVLKREFLDRLSRQAARETTVMLTADHGQIPVNPRATTYLNGMRKLMSYLETSPSGRRIPPWGSARDVYLAVREEKLESAIEVLHRELGEKAAVLKTAKAIEMGLFGLNKPRPRFLERVGNAMILPRSNNLVWYRYERGDSLSMLGHHGGLNPKEMLIPLVVSPVSGLR